MRERGLCSRGLTLPSEHVLVSAREGLRVPPGDVWWPLSIRFTQGCMCIHGAGVSVSGPAGCACPLPPTPLLSSPACLFIMGRWF